MQVLKPFDYSTDGVTLKHLDPGDEPAGVPADLIDGLTAEGYLGAGEPKAKSAKKAPEAKFVEAAPENKAETSGEEA